MLFATILVYKNLEGLKRTISSIQNNVDRIILGVDSRTNIEIIDWINVNNYSHFIFNFNNDYSEAYNFINTKALELGATWNFCIDSDEKMVLQNAEKLKQLVIQGDQESIDAFTFNRINWMNFSMGKLNLTNPKEQIIKLYRVSDSIRFFGRTKPELVNVHKIRKVDINIEHFFFCTNSNEDKNEHLENIEYIKQIELKEALQGKIKQEIKLKNSLITS